MMVPGRAYAIPFAAVLFPAPACAEGPEQLDQIELDEGQWQAEYFGSFSGGEGQGHALELMTGLSDRLALGFEIEGQAEGQAIRVENLGPKIQYRFTSRDMPLAMGLQFQAGFGRGAVLTELEARLIAEWRGAHWWGQADAMLRRSAEEGAVEITSAYGWSLQRRIGGAVWFGAEGSGTLAGGTPEDAAHFIGPSLTFEVETASGHEIEVGLASLATVRGAGPPALLRLFVQVTL